MRAARRQRGTALILALLVLALAAAAAAAMLESQDLQARALQAERDYEQARWMLRGGMHWARSILAEDARASREDHRAELWASGLPPTEVQLGSLAGEIRDEQALFNLNNLAPEGKIDPLQLAVLRRLLTVLGLRPQLAEAIAALVQSGGTLADTGELAGVRGLDADALARLQRFATALPRPTPVNINTAPPELLAALVEGLELAEAQGLARRIASQPLRQRDQFQAQLREGLTVNLGHVAVASQFFVVHGRARVGGADLRMHALLQRAAPGLPAIVWQRAS
jgi:general secretion pathway protein K